MMNKLDKKIVLGITAIALTILAGCGSSGSSDSIQLVVEEGSQTITIGGAVYSGQVEEELGEEEGNEVVLGVVETIRGVGTEPFWGFSVEDNSIVWRTPGDESGVVASTYVGVVQTSSGDQKTYVDTAGKIEIVTTRQDCADGMSDKIYPLLAQVNKGGVFYDGCAELVK